MRNFSNVMEFPTLSAALEWAYKDGAKTFRRDLVYRDEAQKWPLGDALLQVAAFGNLLDVPANLRYVFGGIAEVRPYGEIGSKSFVRAFCFVE